MELFIELFQVFSFPVILRASFIPAQTPTDEETPENLPSELGMRAKAAHSERGGTRNFRKVVMMREAHARCSETLQIAYPW